MSNFLQTMLVSVLLVTSAATNAVDMAKPTGTGELKSLPYLLVAKAPLSTSGAR